MPIGRIALEFWTHPKRAKFERLTRGRWAAKPPLSMSAGEACARILAWLDGLDDSSGQITDIEDMADVAGWGGDPAPLLAALVAAELVDEGDPPTWHNFARLNGSAIRQRNYRRNASHNGPRNEPDNEIRGSGSGSGSGSNSDTGSEDTMSNSEAESDATWAGRWNSICLCSDVPRVRKLTGRRLPRLKAFVKEHGQEAVLVAMAWFVARGLKRDDGTLYGIDTFLVPAKREVYVEASEQWNKAGRPANNGRAGPATNWSDFWEKADAVQRDV